ncbi:MAG: hypothetical protein NT062_12825 [Proteobacteria bacterium]|nr:hypothetical protein [Pseudomonadota bacterium]
MTEPKTQASALLALARARRIQRAHAHATLHRYAPIPTLRQSLGFMTSTARFAEGTNPHARVFDEAALAHRMSVIGVAPADNIAFVVEELGHEDAPVVYRLFLNGPRAGHLVPLHAWYELSAPADVIRARIERLRQTLTPVTRCEHEAWMLSTRVIQRRALRASSSTLATPIRKYALQLVVEPVRGNGPSGKTTVTAFLRPEAELVGAWLLPDGLAIARITYTGIPTGMGASKDTVVLLGGID